jgi:hypothetical protein
MAAVEMGWRTLIKRTDDCYIVNFLKEKKLQRPSIFPSCPKPHMHKI